MITGSFIVKNLITGPTLQNGSNPTETDTKLQLIRNVMILYII